MTDEEYVRLMGEEIKPVEPEIIPVVLHQGRYRLYEKPDGTMRIQYRRDDKDTDDFFEIPGAMIALAKAAAEGKMSPMDMMKSAMGFMRGKHGG